MCAVEAKQTISYDRLRAPCVSEVLQTIMSLPQFELGHVMHCWAHVQPRTDSQEARTVVEGTRDDSEIQEKDSLFLIWIELSL